MGRGAAVGSPPPHPWRLHACRSWCKEPEVSRRVSPSPSHPHPHLQAPTAGLARIHAAGWPSPQAGLPGLAQLWPWGGSGRPPGRGQAAGWAAAQLFRGAGGSLRGGGLSLPAYVVTPAPWYQGTPFPMPQAAPAHPAGMGIQPQGPSWVVPVGRTVALERDHWEDTNPVAGLCHTRPQLCCPCRAAGRCQAVPGHLPARPAKRMLSLPQK